MAVLFLFGAGMPFADFALRPETSQRQRQGDGPGFKEATSKASKMESRSSNGKDNHQRPFWWKLRTTIRSFLQQ